MRRPADRAPAPPPAGGGRTHDVFLSYSHEAKADVAQPLAGGLEKKGVRVWWDHDAVEIGDGPPQRIREGLAGARYGVAIVSRGYLASGWGRTELGAMFRRSLAVFPILHGVDAEEAKRSLPAVSETVMREWKDPPTQIIRAIANRINCERTGGRPAGAAGVPGGSGWKAPLDRSSRGSVMATPQAIVGKTIPRTAEARGIERLLAVHGRVAVIGDRGSGKSALVCQVYERLKESTAAAFVRGDDFLGSESFDELDRSIAPGHSFVSLVERAASGGGGAVVIIDSLDAIARDRGAMRAFRRLAREVWGVGAKTIVTVRSYDYRHSGLIVPTEWGAEYRLDALSGRQVSEVLGHLGIARVPEGLAPLLASPLNLHLLSRAAGPGGGADLARISHEIDIYDAHWRRSVEQEEVPGRVRDALYGAARGMMDAGRMSIPRSLLDGDAEAADRALRAGVLCPVPHTGRVRFFHHAYLDYAMSRAVLDDGAGVMGLLRSDEYNMFVRPTLPLTFAMAHRRAPREFAGLVAKVLGSDLKHYWKMTAASALARIRGGPAAEYGRAGRLLTEKKMLQRRFLAEAAEQKNAFWLGAWGGSFLAEWASDEKNPNGCFLAEYARAAAVASADPALHALAFALLRSVAESGQSGAARQRAVVMMAGIDAPGRAAWLERTSESADARARDGVARILPDLLSTDPDSVPGAFASLFAYEEAPGSREAPAGASSARMAASAEQDNAMVKRVLEKGFPGMLRERPDVMIRAAARAVERIYAGASDPPPKAGSLVDAGPDALLDALLPHQPSDAVMPAVWAHLEACDDGEFDRLAPLLAGSRLGSLRSMLIDGMAGRGAAYLPRLVDELADPRAYEHRLMQASAKWAIGRVAGLLSAGQAARILGAIMKSNRPGDLLKSALQYEDRLRARQEEDCVHGEASATEEDYGLAAPGPQGYPKDAMKSAKLQSRRARAQFLAEFPEVMLGGEHLELVAAHCPPGAPGAAGRPPLPLDFSFQEMPVYGGVDGAAKPPPPAPPGGGAGRSREESILAAIGKEDREGRIALLESISEYLDGPGGGLDGALLPRIEECLLECAVDPDPDPDPDPGGAAGEPAMSAVDHQTVRGLAALCLAKMVALRGGGEAEGALRGLAADHSGAVRGGVARGLAHLLPRRYDLAYPMLLECSRDPDARVRLFMGDRFDVVLSRDPAQASAVVENVLASGGPPMLGTVDYLLVLALVEKDPRAASLLDRVAGGDAPLGVRAEVPFALKPYLSSPAHRDAALGIFLRLLKAGPDAVRSKAAFFTLDGIRGGNGGGWAAADPDYARKIAPHLDLLASLFGRGQLDLQTAERAVQFLKDHWGDVPRAALSCLEAIARGRPSPAHQPVLAQCTASIVSGMIERYMPGDGEWRRCLDMLDAYAEAGWPEVLGLLAAMERPD